MSEEKELQGHNVEAELAAAHAQILDLQAQATELEGVATKAKRALSSSRKTLKKTRAELNDATESLVAARGELSTEVTEDVANILKRRCINCGAPSQTTHNAGKFTCGSCGHTWTMEEEDSPHRRAA